MRYELWDSETGNRVGSYPTRDAALLAVREDAELYGHEAEALTSLGLVLRKKRGSVLVAEGRKLVDLALSLGRVESTTTKSAVKGRVNS